MTRLWLDIVPMAAPRQSRRDRFDPSPAVQRYRAFCHELVIKADLAGGWRPGEQLHVVFHLPMPRSWSGRKRRQMAGQPHRCKPDGDNLLKAVCDCLLTDDSYIWDWRGRKYWAEAGAIEVMES